MSPTGRYSTRSIRSSSSSRKRTLLKNKHPSNSKNQENSTVSPDKPFLALPKANSSENLESQVNMMSCNDVGTSCSTPKAKRYQIPEVKTCPPPPKKQRIASASSCSLTRKPMTFFAPPDIDVFFYFALRGIQV